MHRGGQIIEIVRYADDHPDQVGDLYVPGDPRPVLVVLVHGGFWYSRYGRDNIRGLAEDLTRRRYPVWSIEYRRLGDGGGWPATFEDVARAFDHVPSLSVPHDRLIAVGHSAGGHLALWAAARHRLPEGRVGASPAVLPHAVVGLAAVSDLRAAARDGLGRDAVTKLLGAQLSAVPERVRVAAPMASLPLGVPQLLVHGRDDELVPFGMSEQYARQARAAGDEVEVVAVAGGHFELLDPEHASWGEVVRRLDGLG